VGGMAVETADDTIAIEGLTLRFCSGQCRSTFTAAPERYLRASGLPLPAHGVNAGAAQP
jgi:YHS domain-containing protein